MSYKNEQEDGYRLAASHHTTEYLRVRSLDKSIGGEQRGVYEAALHAREVDCVGPAARVEVFHVMAGVRRGLCGETGRVTKWVENADCVPCLEILQGESGKS